jgi:hypothetical protein
MIEHHHPSDGPNTRARRRRDRRARQAVLAAVVVVVLVGGFLVTTSVTGFPGPGAVHRYPIADLQDLAKRINRTTCSGGGDWAPTPVASVDWFRSRVHLSGPPAGVVLAPEDRPMVENPPAGSSTSGDVSMVRCVGTTLAG